MCRARLSGSRLGSPLSTTTRHGAGGSQPSASTTLPDKHGSQPVAATRRARSAWDRSRSRCSATTEAVWVSDRMHRRRRAGSSTTAQIEPSHSVPRPHRARRAGRAGLARQGRRRARSERASRRNTPRPRRLAMTASGTLAADDGRDPGRVRDVLPRRSRRAPATAVSSMVTGALDEGGAGIGQGEEVVVDRALGPQRRSGRRAVEDATEQPDDVRPGRVVGQLDEGHAEAVGGGAHVAAAGGAPAGARRRRCPHAAARLDAGRRRLGRTSTPTPRSRSPDWP